MASLFSSSWSASKIPDLAKRIYLVTGGTSGIGFGIVANLLQHNPEKIYMLSENNEHADLAKQELHKYGDPTRVEWIACNLQNLKEVNRTAKHLKEKLKRIDALIANAGIGVGVYNETPDGIDSHFQVNHLSQMHLILTLLPNLLNTARETKDARVVLQSSDLHKAAPSSIKFASLEEINEDIGPAYLYNRTKLAQILFAKALVRRLNDGRLSSGGNHNVFVNATHPGAVSTMQQEQAEEAYGILGTVGVAVTRPFMKDPIKDGCMPALYAAVSPDVKEQHIQGQYIVPPGKVSEPSTQAQDEALGEQLWTLSEKVLENKL